MQRLADDVADLDIEAAGCYAKILAALLGARSGTLLEPELPALSGIPADVWERQRATLASVFDIEASRWSHPIVTAFRLLAGQTTPAQRERRRRRATLHDSLVQQLEAAGIETAAATPAVAGWLAAHDPTRVARALEIALAIRRPDPLAAVSEQLARPDAPLVPDISETRYGNHRALEAVRGRDLK
jgi:hypothetical protein